MKVARGCMVVVGALVVLIIIIVIVAAGSGSSGSGKTTGYKLAVSAPAGDHWSGAIGNSTVDGSGSRTVPFKDSSITAATVQKMTGGSWALKLTLSEGGKVVDRESTSASYGVATVQAG